jgi:hypothetical protein
MGYLRGFKRLLCSAVTVIFLVISSFPQQSTNAAQRPLSALSFSACNFREPLSSAISADSVLPLCPDAIAANLETAPRKPAHHEGFHWRRALGESFAFLSMQHSVLVMMGDKKYIYTGIPFNHYWHDYKVSLHSWRSAGWDDGDPFLDNYIGHPIQGALTGYIQVQNDPAGRALEFENTKRYWVSRLKAMAWAAAYSTQWEIGPLGEMTVEKYGAWNGVGAVWMHNGKLVNGEGQVDLVVTPIGALGWMVMEDYMDHKVARAVENRVQNRFLINVVRCTVSPIRSGVNLLHWRWPWWRESRDVAHSE